MSVVGGLPFKRPEEQVPVKGVVVGPEPSEVRGVAGVEEGGTRPDGTEGGVVEGLDQEGEGASIQPPDPRVAVGPPVL